MLLEAFIERRESFWLSWAVKGIAAAVWKQRLSIFKLDTKPTRYPPNRQQCPILVCSFVCTKAAPVGCACRRNATDYGSLPIWKAFSTLNRPRLIFFLFFETWRAIGMLLTMCPPPPLLLRILHITRIKRHIKSPKATNGKQSECGRILFCCTIPSQNGLTGCKFFVF